MSHIKSMADLEALRAEASADPEAFWARLAESELHWFKKWDEVLKWEPPHAQWFLGGQINISYNCLDRHLSTWRRNKAALIWEGEPGDTRTLTYQQLHTEICRFANVLKKIGVAMFATLFAAFAYRNISFPSDARTPTPAWAAPGCLGARVMGAGFGGSILALVEPGGEAALREALPDAPIQWCLTADGPLRRGFRMRGP